MTKRSLIKLIDKAIATTNFESMETDDVRGRIVLLASEAGEARRFEIRVTTRKLHS